MAPMAVAVVHSHFSSSVVMPATERGHDVGEGEMAAHGRHRIPRV
jgi:hypothetical protein